MNQPFLISFVHYIGFSKQKGKILDKYFAYAVVKLLSLSALDFTKPNR
jgi:hypothetical protein